jgi:hypothetical protein
MTFCVEIALQFHKCVSMLFSLNIRKSGWKKCVWGTSNILNIFWHGEGWVLGVDSSGSDISFSHWNCGDWGGWGSYADTVVEQMESQRGILHAYLLIVLPFSSASKFRKNCNPLQWCHHRLQATHSVFLTSFRSKQLSTVKVMGSVGSSILWMKRFQFVAIWSLGIITPSVNSMAGYVRK